MTHYQRAGADQERAIVKYARGNGFPGADRIIRTGAGKDYGHRADEGDIWLSPGLVCQSKRLSPIGRAERAVPKWMTETEAQRKASGADIALLIVRREGTTDIGEWWAWLDLTTAVWLRTGFDALNRDTTVRIPVRLLVRDAIALLRTAGYGTIPERQAA